MLVWLGKFKKDATLKKFLNQLLNRLVFTLLCMHCGYALGSQDKLKEYGIVVLPEDKCTQRAAEFNKYIAENLSNFENAKNHWHVTLYHGAYEEKDLDAIYKKLQALPLKPFIISFTNIYPTADRWIDWGMEKNPYLHQLHEAVINLAGTYHKRPLHRVKDVYGDLSKDKRKQVDEYGVNGLFTMYNPHMTLFYKYPPDISLQEAAKKAAGKFPNTNMQCAADKIALGELGYNGNIIKVLYTVKIPQ